MTPPRGRGRQQAGRGWPGGAGVRRGPACGVAGIGAIGVIIVGAAPMALATRSKTADPIIAQAIAGSTGAARHPAPDFTLTSQGGRPVALTSLRGKAVLLAFLDPVCTTDCPLIAAEMRSADLMLGARASDTELVAVVANPTYTPRRTPRRSPGKRGSTRCRTGCYLTGSLSQLQAVWNHFGIEVENLPAGAMAAHNDIAFVISPKGVIQQEINADPRPGHERHQVLLRGLMADSVLPVAGSGSDQVTRLSPPLARRSGRRRGAAIASAPRRGVRRVLVRCRGGRHGTAAPGLPLATSLASATDSWAVVPMASEPDVLGGVRPAGQVRDLAAGHAARRRRQRRPGRGGRHRQRPLTVAVRPSQDLEFTPLASTADAGASWSPAGRSTPG